MSYVRGRCGRRDSGRSRLWTHARSKQGACTSYRNYEKVSGLFRGINISGIFNLLLLLFFIYAEIWIQGLMFTAKQKPHIFIDLPHAVLGFKAHRKKIIIKKSIDLPDAVISGWVFMFLFFVLSFCLLVLLLFCYEAVPVVEFMYLVFTRVRVTVGDSGHCCCTCVTSVER